MKIASIWNPFKPQWFPIVQALPFVCTTGLGMHNTSHLSAQLGASAGGTWGLVSICFQLRDTENGQWCHASNRQNLWHFLAREIWFVNAGQLASRVACQEVPHLWLDCVHSVVKWEKTEQEKQIEPPETPNSYCCEDREKMVTAGSTIPRALAQRGCLGQHKSWTPSIHLFIYLYCYVYIIYQNGVLTSEIMQ